jgi:hemerythrin superfamily protein
MNAIEMLEQQHRQVEQLFSQIEKESAEQAKRRLFLEIADALAIHAAIEERHFYPAVKARRTEEILLESLEEHLSIKRTLADMLRTEISDPTFDAKLKWLKEEVTHHVGEEESDLFPKVKKLMDADQLEGIAQEMTATAAELAQGEPHEQIPEETDRAPSLH